MTKARSDSAIPPVPTELDDAALAAASGGFFVLPEVDDQVAIRAQNRPGLAGAPRPADGCKWEISEFDALTPKP